MGGYEHGVGKSKHGEGVRIRCDSGAYRVQLPCAQGVNRV